MAILFLGALVGGPDEFDVFVNNRTDFVRNQVALDYNAAITALSAVLLDMERGNIG
jgi:endoglucanase